MAAASRWKSALWLCALAYLLLGSYALVRPAAESLFVELHGSEGLPSAWLGVAAGVLAAVGAYNAAAARLSLAAVLLASLALTAAILLGILAASQAHPALSAYALYVWKDVHIVVLLEGLWSFANVVFSTRQARWLYGLFLAAGSLGGMSGNLLVGELAAAGGTSSVFLWVLPLFAAQGAVIGALHLAAGRPRPPERRSAPAIGESLVMLRRSPYLGLMLALVGLVQLVVNLVDFRFQQMMEAAFADPDARTAAIGQIYAAIDAGALGLQLAAGPILRWVGMRGILVGVPLLVGGLVVAAAIVPKVALVAALKVGSKVFDYSLFRAAKEMLYIPLSYAEKTRGKAVVDMLTYRASKGVASLLAGVLAAFGAGAWGVGATTLALVAGWLGVTFPLLRRHHRALESRRAQAAESVTGE